jgi:pilus assembly protein CpaB
VFLLGGVDKEGIILMSRGGRLLLIVGIVIAAAAAVLLFFYLQNLPNASGGTGNTAAAPTATPDPGVNIIVVSAEAGDLPAGVIISDTNLLSTKNIPTAEFNGERAKLFINISDVLNKLTTKTILAGERVRKDDITEPGLAQQIGPAEEGRPRDKAIAFKVDALTAVADQVKERDYVDIVATFTIQRRVSLPGPITEVTIGGQAIPQEARTFEVVDFVTTKTLVQRVQVAKIVRPPPPPPAEGQQAAPAAAEPTPAVDASGQPVQPQAAPAQGANLTAGNWVFVLLMNDQESELLDFARNSDAKISLVLRGAGDTTFETTTGATLDLLIAQYGLQLPDPLAPYSYGRDILDPQPTRTPAPTRVP